MCEFYCNCLYSLTEDSFQELSMINKVQYCLVLPLFYF